MAKTEIGEAVVSFTARGLARYEIKVQHLELKKLQVIRGDDRIVVEQKARLLAASWDEIWNQKLAKSKREQKITDKKNLATLRTQEAQQILSALESVLADTLKIDDALDWDTLKNTSDYSVEQPAKPFPPTEPIKQSMPNAPKIDDPQYKPKLNLLDRLIPSRAARKRAAAEYLFNKDAENWKSRKKSAEINHEIQLEQHKKRLLELEQKHEIALKAWERNRDKYIKQRDANNDAIEVKKQKYWNGDGDAIKEYYEIVLSNSKYPDFIPNAFEIDYNPRTKIIIVDYQLPSLSDIPKLKEVKYVQSHNQFEEKFITDSHANKLYDNLLYQIALRTIHELFEADKVNSLDSIVFNGHVCSIDQATGNEVNACILSIQALLNEFNQINLSAVDPKACFKKLKGVGSSKLHSLTPIAPILSFQKDDKRFTDSYCATSGLEEDFNLAAMDWEDFEHLIRELFEREFSASGGEVKVTRASRDGGVDAVAFDPDPIRGGKIVIQAKRYTNTVGVSAVRDLYGTVMNEGATKGILVSTADYGPDAYEFARGKPLTLLNGNNLLHLLQKHGYSAKIDLNEAKKTMENMRSR